MTNQLEISNLLAPLIKAFKAFGKEWQNLFKEGLNEYLEIQADKYYFTNTFIHRSEKVKLDDIYHPIKAKYGKLNTNFNDLESVFKEYKKITIVGSAGSGKTTLIKHIFLKSIVDKQKIPILIELRTLNEYNGDFEKLIADKALKGKIKPSEGIFKRALESGKFLFLLDGYDEIFSTRQHEITRQIEQFVDAFPNNYFLITTRPGSGIEMFPGFHDFKVQPLTDNDVNDFIDKIVENSERKNSIKHIVFDPKSMDYQEFLRNPLLLSMFIMAFESHPEIPNKKSAFYRNVFDTLYSRHDGITKNSFARERRTKLQRDDFEKILSTFSYLTLSEKKYSFTYESLTDVLNKIKKSSQYNYITEELTYDLRTSISILILDGFEYYFPHRSIQEYFTAFFIKELPTEKKHTAYSKLSSVLEKSSTDHSFNFWNLCFELDETAFVSNFLIPQLKRIYTLLEGKKDEVLGNVFFDLIHPQLNRFGGKIKLSFMVYKSTISILNFYKVYDYLNILSLPEVNSSRYEELDKILQEEQIKKFIENGKVERNSNEVIIPLNIQSKMANILCDEKFYTLLEDFRANLLEKIEALEKDIMRRADDIDDLLN